MDPDACLREIREIVNHGLDHEELSRDDTSRLLELVVALDGWLSKGGFLPNSWQKS